MPTMRQRHGDTVLRLLAQQRHPSHQLLDRLERSLRTREDLEVYGVLLHRLLQAQRHPSPRLLDRFDECALACERYDMQAERQTENA